MEPLKILCIYEAYLEDTEDNARKRSRVNPLNSERLMLGQFHTLYDRLCANPDIFHDYYHLPLHVFQELLQLLKPFISNLGPLAPRELNSVGLYVWVGTQLILRRRVARTGLVCKPYVNRMQQKLRDWQLTKLRSFGLTLTKKWPKLWNKNQISAAFKTVKGS